MRKNELDVEKPVLISCFQKKRACHPILSSVITPKLMQTARTWKTKCPLAAGGIGLATANAFALAGASVVVAD